MELKYKVFTGKALGLNYNGHDNQGDVVTCRETQVDNDEFHIIHGNFGCECQSIK